MGRSKALLAIAGETFVERAVWVLREGGCGSVVVVVSTDEELARRAERAGGRVVVNPAADAEPIDSLRLGLDALQAGDDAAAVLPVDHPLVRPATVAALLAAYRATRAPIVRPVHRGSPGHPTLFARSLFPSLRSPGLPEGARSVVDANLDRIVEVPVDDPGAAVDIDTPDAYRRLVERAS